MNEKMNVLICDDDLLLLGVLSQKLSPHFNVHTAASVEDTEIILDSIKFDIAIVDINFSNGPKTGATIQDILSRRAPQTTIVIHSGDSDIKRIVSVTQRKYEAFLLKGETCFSQILATLKRIEKIKIAQKELIYGRLTTFSPAMLEVLDKIETIIEKNNTSPILILGESGVGKDHLVNYIAHRLKIKNLVCENMHNVPDSLAESKLFGHIKGSFTGATENSVGLFEQANGGILFMDEIGEASLSTQTKTLRTLQDGTLLRVGENKFIKVNFRLISGTNRDIPKMVKEGTFREDLYYRINSFQITIPPLRERKEDILFLANQFLADLNFKNKGKEQYVFADDANEALSSYSWPGNIRQLSSFIETINVEMPAKYIISKDDIFRLLNKKNNPKAYLTESIEDKKASEKVRIEYALKEASGNVVKAANRLKMNRATLYKKIKSHSIDLDYYEKMRA